MADGEQQGVAGVGRDEQPAAGLAADVAPAPPRTVDPQERLGVPRIESIRSSWVPPFFQDSGRINASGRVGPWVFDLEFSWN